MNVTRAVLPVMREQRSGHIITISSSAGLGAGYDFVSAYAASKFGLEGWMESLGAEVAPFGIATTIVNPGFFRTDFSRINRRGTPRRRSPTMTSLMMYVRRREMSCTTLSLRRMTYFVQKPRMSGRMSQISDAIPESGVEIPNAPLS
jgi:NAD(P)-dependent dehydrogenase (short-subunit alcohol dehydrogenase family)